MLNAIGIGSGINLNLLNQIVFPRPAGGDRGFVITVSNFEEYIEGIASKIALETRVPDLTVGAMALTDQGSGLPATVSVTLGNAGSANISESIEIQFHDGDPAEGGALIGTLLYEGGLVSGEHVVLTLEDVDTSTLSHGSLHAVAVISGGVSECNYSNNSAQVDVDARRGHITLHLDGTVFPPFHDMPLLARVTNTGALAGEYRATLRIEDNAGNIVAQIHERSDIVLAGGTSVDISASWHTGAVLAGHYQAVAELYDRDDHLLDTATAVFRIGEGDGSGGLITHVRVGTDRAVYHTTDVVRLENLVRNLSVTTLVQDAIYQVTIHSAQGVPIYASEIPLYMLYAGQTITLPQDIALEAVQPGLYDITGRLLSGTGAVLASDSTSFMVENNLAVSLLADVSAAKPVLFRGEPQSCAFSLTNTGHDSVTNLSLRWQLVDIDAESVSGVWSDNLSLTQNAQHDFEQPFSTATLSVGSHACVLEAEINDAFVVLASDIFRVEEPPVAFELALTQPQTARTLVLVDKVQDTCAATRSVTLEAHFPSTQSNSANIYAKALSHILFLHDMEHARPGAFNGDVNNNSGHKVDIAISHLDREKIRLTLTGAQMDSERFNFVVEYPLLYIFQGSLRTGYIQFECGNPPVVGDTLGDFTVVDVELEERALPAPGAHWPYPWLQRTGPHGGPLLERPDMTQQRAWLHHALADQDATVVDNYADFVHAFRSGQYQQYLLLSQRVRLDHWTAKALREAVFRGDGLVYATGALPDEKPLFEVLGLSYLRHHPLRWGGADLLDWHLFGRDHFRGYGTSDGINLTSSPLYPDDALVDFGLDRIVPVLPPYQAASAGMFVAPRRVDRHPLFFGLFGFNNDLNGDYPAISYHDYGKGRAVYAAFDLLAEATEAGTDTSPFAVLFKNSLAHTLPDEARARHEAEAVPVQLTIDNKGNATSLSAQIVLPAGGVIESAMPEADINDAQAQWQLHMDEGDLLTLQAWLRPHYVDGSAEVWGSAQDGMGVLERTATLTLNAGQESEDIHQLIHDLAAMIASRPYDLHLKAASVWLLDAKTKWHLGANRLGTRAALLATTELARASHPDAAALRERVGWLIWQQNL